MISLIVASSKNGVIGKDNQLPWHLPADLKRFKQLTMGHPIIMGRKTYESIGRPLPGRSNIVISQQAATEKHPDTIYCNDPLAAVEQAMTLSGAEEIFIIGGAQIYQSCLARCDRVYLTLVDREIQGDAYFPLDALKDFVTDHQESFAADGQQPGYSFITMSRVQSRAN